MYFPGFGGFVGGRYMTWERTHLFLWDLGFFFSTLFNIARQGV